MTPHQKNKIIRQVFSIMQRKLKGKNSEVQKHCWRMVKAALDIYKLHKVYPYKIRQKHILEWLDDICIFIESDNTQYNYYRSIKKFCECRNKWENWSEFVNLRNPKTQTVQNDDDLNLLTEEDWL